MEYLSGVREGASRQAGNLFECFSEIRPESQHGRSTRQDNADAGGRAENLSRPRAPFLRSIANCAAKALTSYLRGRNFNLSGPYPCGFDPSGIGQRIRANELAHPVLQF